jgi:hypothetical protein
MWQRNSMGPSTVPCGTPESTVTCWDDSPSNVTLGFRSGYSCETQLLITINDLLKSYDKGKQIDMAILVFSKAFDTVPHKKLLHKLDQYEISGPVGLLCDVRYVCTPFEVF